MQAQTDVWNQVFANCGDLIDRAILDGATVEGLLQIWNERAKPGLSPEFEELVNELCTISRNAGKAEGVLESAGQIMDVLESTQDGCHQDALEEQRRRLSHDLQG